MLVLPSAVTLLAAANAAPDLSAGILAMQQGNIGLSLGSIVGAAAFVQMIVLSQVWMGAQWVGCMSLLLMIRMMEFLDYHGDDIHQGVAVQLWTVALTHFNHV